MRARRGGPGCGAAAASARASGALCGLAPISQAPSLNARKVGFHGSSFRVASPVSGSSPVSIRFLATSRSLMWRCWEADAK